VPAPEALVPPVPSAECTLYPNSVFAVAVVVMTPPEVM
jgi:hypothetical protein